MQGVIWQVCSHGGWLDGGRCRWEPARQGGIYERFGSGRVCYWRSAGGDNIRQHQFYEDRSRCNLDLTYNPSVYRRICRLRRARLSLAVGHQPPSKQSRPRAWPDTAKIPAAACPPRTQLAGRSSGQHHRRSQRRPAGGPRAVRCLADANLMGAARSAARLARRGALTRFVGNS
jgi:hypothetical protein